MRVLILGCGGMLGHKLLSSLSKKYDAFGILHNSYIGSGIENLISKDKVIENIDARDNAKVYSVIEEINPKVVINCIGMIKQREALFDPISNIEMNSLLPHKLAKFCETINVRFIHFSTDCVFSGKKGNYSIKDITDADDIYGRTKCLGEVSYSNCITIRTSIIGLELKYKQSLIEWFLSQKGKIKGYTNAIYSGFTTAEISRVIGMLLENHNDLSGVYHVASSAIDKYSLLTSLSKKLNRKDILIERYDNFSCDRSLNGDEFNSIIDYKPPDWEMMLSELANEIEQRGDLFE